MAGIKISGLPLAGALDSANVFPLNQLNVTTQASIADLTNYFQPLFGAQGLSGAVQYNNAGALAGDDNFTTDGVGNVSVTTIQAGTGGILVDNFINDDTMATATDSNVPSSESVVNYVLAQIANSLNLTIYTPDLQTGTFVDFDATYNNGVSGVGATLTANSVGVVTLSGYNVLLGDYVLFSGQTDSYENGIYECTIEGDVGTAAEFTRPSNYDDPSEIKVGSIAHISDSSGSSLAGQFYLQTKSVTTVGTDPIEFVSVFSAGGIFLMLSGGTMSGNIDMDGNDVLDAGTVSTSSMSMIGNQFLDSSSNVLFELEEVASATAYLKIRNAVSTSPALVASGSAADISMIQETKGTGVFGLYTEALTDQWNIFTGTGFAHRMRFEFPVTAGSNTATWRAASGTVAYLSDIPSLSVPVTVPQGGTGLSTLTPYAIMAAGTTATANMQQVGLGTTGQILQSQGNSALPAYTTATYPGTTTINRLLYSSANNVVGEIATANGSMLVTSSTGVPAMTASMTDGQIVIGSTSGTPSPATLTAGDGIVITNASGGITISNGSVVQYVIATSSVDDTTTAGTYVSSSLSASITPKSASNKIVALCWGTGYNECTGTATGARQLNTEIYRTSGTPARISAGSAGPNITSSATAFRYFSTFSVGGTETAGSTSAQTYVLRYCGNSLQTTSAIQGTVSPAFMLLLELKA